MKLIDILVEELPKRGGWDAKWHQCAQDGNGEVCFFTSGKIHFRGSFDVWNIPPDSVARHDGESRLEASLADDYAETIITREQYEAALAAKNDDWIDWGGGECPVGPGTIVDYVMQDGSESERPEEARALRWDFCVKTEPYAIIAYRLHKPQEEERTEAGQEADLNDCIGQTPTTEWNGEGLPPVGTQCEFISNDTSWGTVDVIGFDSDKVVFKPSGETYYGMVPSQRQIFRPIRSEADKKRDNAKHAIAELCRSSASNGHAADLIYDAIAAGEIPGVKLGD